MKTYLLPGMGADRRMFPGPWGSLPNVAYIEWRSYAGETSIRGLASWIIADHSIAPGDLLVGCSLGGIVACEIANITAVAGLVLVGSAKNKGEINPFVSMLHPLIDLTPLAFVQRLAASVPHDIASMFSDSDPVFLRAMCRAIFVWEGLKEGRGKSWRIHGKADRVIPAPKGVDHLLPGGHLIAITHAQECVNVIRDLRLAQPAP